MTLNSFHQFCKQLNKLFSIYKRFVSFQFALLIFLVSFPFTVRQENERLMQDSMNRAKMAVNFTDPPILTTSSSPSHPTLKMLQGNFVP